MTRRRLVVPAIAVLVVIVAAVAVALFAGSDGRDDGSGVRVICPEGATRGSGQTTTSTTTAGPTTTTLPPSGSISGPVADGRTIGGKKCVSGSRTGSK